MSRVLLALLLLVATPLWAAEPKELTWSEMIPPDAPPEAPDMTPLHDLSQMGIPFDRADARDLAAPRGWDMSGLVRFTLIMGPLSSVFDIATIAMLIQVFHVDVETFRAAWFIDSMATQILVVFVIRTAGRLWGDRPHPVLVATTLIGLAVALMLPFLPLAPLLGFAAPGWRVLSHARS